MTDGLLYLGKQGKLSHKCRAALAEGLVMERTAFFKDYLWTETSKRLAEERFGFFVEFLERLAEEVVEGELVIGDQGSGNQGIALQVA